MDPDIDEFDEDFEIPDDLDGEKTLPATPGVLFLSGFSYRSLVGRGARPVGQLVCESLVSDSKQVILKSPSSSHFTVRIG